TSLSFDNRGTGSSQPLAAPISVPQMSLDTLALMDHLGWDSAHIVGHSLGVLIALELALIAKPRVRSLSLLCGFARGADAVRLTPAFLWLVLRLRFGTPDVRRKAFVELVLAPGQTTRAHYEEFARRFSRVLGHDIDDLLPVCSQQVAAMREHDVTERLAGLSGIPALVVSGEKDRIARPASGRALAAGIPGSRYVEIPGAAHALPILQAERC